MKILICHNGIRVRIQYMARLLKDEGHSISMMNLSSGNFFVNVAKTIPLIVKNDVLLIYPSSIKAFLPIMVSKLFKKPCIFDFFYSTIQARIFENNWNPHSLLVTIGRLIEKGACKNANHVIVHSNSELDWIINEYNLERKNLSALLHFADPTLYYPRQKDKRLVKSLNLQDRFIIEYNGRFLEMHGVEFILSSIPYVINRYPHVMFVFVDIEKRSKFFENYKRRIKALGVTNHVVFTTQPSLQSHPKYLALADVFLGAFSGKEKVQITFRGTTLEAMAMGKPIITAKTREMERTLKDRKNVLLCLPENPEDLAKKITMLIENDRLRETLRKGSLTFVKQGNFEERFFSIINRSLPNV